MIGADGGGRGVTDVTTGVVWATGIVVGEERGGGGGGGVFLR